MRMSIRLKILSAFFVVVFLNTILILFIFYFSSLQKNLIDIMPALSQVESFNMRITSKLYEAITKMSADDISEAKKIMFEMDAFLKNISDIGFSQEVKTFRGSMESYIGLFEDVIKGDEEAMAKLAESKKILDSSYENIRISIISSIKRYSNIILFLVLSAIPFTIIIGGASSMVISRSILRGIRKVAVVLGEIAKGGTNLKLRIKYRSGDEIETLTDNFDSFMDSLADIIKKLLMESDSLKESCFSARGSYSKILDESEKVQQYMSSVQNSTQFVWDQIESIAQRGAEILSFQKDSSQKISQEISQIRKNIEMFEKIEERFGQLFSKAGELERMKKEISGYVSAINDISDIINILSLNASIEAGRVGEKGKGFAVVADEIRKLSSRTKIVSTSIGKSVGVLTDVIVSVVETIKFIDNEIKKIADENRRSLISLQSIDVLSKRSVDMITEISNAVEQIRSMTKEVSKRVLESVQAIQGIGEHISGFEKYMSSIMKVSEDLRTIVSKFEI
ncbi:MAG: methyl-accepting chemotaxis protein [bacterium]|nr:methyl-accepting chemotaxis protein [bacterium]